jgi:hypothetical protein
MRSPDSGEKGAPGQKSQKASRMQPLTGPTLKMSRKQRSLTPPLLARKTRGGHMSGRRRECAISWIRCTAAIPPERFSCGKPSVRCRAVTSLSDDMRVGVGRGAHPPRGKRSFDEEFHRGAGQPPGPAEGGGPTTGVIGVATTPSTAPPSLPTTENPATLVSCRR